MVRDFVVIAILASGKSLILFFFHFLEHETVSQEKFPTRNRLDRVRLGQRLIKTALFMDIRVSYEEVHTREFDSGKKREKKFLFVGCDFVSKMHAQMKRVKRRFLMQNFPRW